MSKILNRPMFRGGGKVSSYGNGIATGLADGGRVNLGFGGALKGGLGTSNYSTATKGLSKSGFRFPRLSSSLRALGQVAPQALRGIGFNAATGAAALPAAGIYGLMQMNSANTDEGLKVMRNEPSGTFDETGAFEMEDYSKRFNDANKIGNKISFMDNFLLDPETGTYPKFMGRTGDREKLAAIEEENNIDDFETNGSAAKVLEGETALDAVMRTALKRKKSQADAKSLVAGFTDDRKPDLSDKEKVKESKELYKELLSGDKSARIADLSDWALSLFEKSTKEGATVRSMLGEVAGEISKKPSRVETLDRDASKLAIQDLMMERKAKADAEAFKGKTDYQYKLKSYYDKIGTDPQNLSWDVNKQVAAKSFGKGPDNAKVIEAALQSKTGKNVEREVDVSKFTDPEKLQTLDVGLYVVGKSGELEVIEIIVDENGFKTAKSRADEYYI